MLSEAWQSQKSSSESVVSHVIHTVQVQKKFPFRFRTTVVQRCCVKKKTVQKHSMNGTVAFLLTVLLHVYMMKRFPLPCM